MTIEEIMREKSVPVVVANDAGFITYVNEAFQAVFGWSTTEIVGRALTTLIPESLHDAHHLGFSRFVTTGQPTLLGRRLMLRAVDKAGREFDAEHFIVAEQGENGWVFAATIKPRSESIQTSKDAPQ